MTLKEKFKSNPQLYYALSIAATWAGIGSLMNGVTMTQTYGVIPSLIWVLGNTVACILFGAVALKIPKVREVFGSRIMKWICGIMCVFQAWLSMNGMQTVFADTSLGVDFGMYVAYALAVIFLLILLRFGMIRNVLTDGFGWIIVYLMAVGVTVAAAIHSCGSFNTIPLIRDAESMKIGLWKAFLLLPGPFTYEHVVDLFRKSAVDPAGQTVAICGGLVFLPAIRVILLEQGPECRIGELNRILVGVFAFGLQRLVIPWVILFDGIDHLLRGNTAAKTEVSQSITHEKPPLTSTSEDDKLRPG